MNRDHSVICREITRNGEDE
ncbi:MAG: hypothetical protein LBD75_02760 [Candidatus Peribacteria bacterium]|nr:hypothetical protein [Candidatus Peribacteria bacterium]